MTWSESLFGPNVVLGNTEERPSLTHKSSKAIPRRGPSLSSNIYQCFQGLRKCTGPTPGKSLADGLGKADLLLELLYESLDRRSTIAHDKSYALLRMASIKPQDQLPTGEGISAQFSVDYSRPIKQVYQEFARYIMHNRGVHAILTMNRPFGTNKQQRACPIVLGTRLALAPSGSATHTCTTTFRHIRL